MSLVVDCSHALVPVLVFFVCILATTRGQAVDPLSPLVYEVPRVEPPTRFEPLRVTFTGTDFSSSLSVRLSNNATQCSTGVAYASLSGVPGTVSNVFTWSLHSPSTFFVALLQPAMYGDYLYVCYTRDGVYWHKALSARGRPYFRIWVNAPTAKVAPQTAVANHPLYVYPSGGGTAMSNARGSLITDPIDCEGTTPSNVLAGGAATQITSNVFQFLPAATADHVYLCVASGPLYDSWSVVPFDREGVTVWSSNGIKRVPTGLLAPNRHAITIYSESVRQRLATVSCSTMIAGADVRCEVSMANKTEFTIDPTKLRVEALKDGAGNDECPLPAFHTVPTTPKHAYFTWVPQRMGHGGLLELSYDGQLLLIADNALNQEFYRYAGAPLKKLNDTLPYVLHNSDDKDLRWMRFVVQAPFTDHEDYTSLNLLNLTSFAPTTNWNIGYVPTKGRQNASVDGEILTATLKNTTLSGTISQTVTLPSGTYRCRFVEHYLFDPYLLDFTTTVNIGRVSVVAVGSSGSDVATIKTFYLYYSGKKVVVTGGAKADALNGDVGQMEQVAVDVPVVVGYYYKLRVELEAYHVLSHTLYFGSPLLQCRTQPHTPDTEVAALKRIYQLVGTSATSGFAHWVAAPGVFNGDPCANQWQGVVCRHNHVVELRLNNVGLKGALPPLGELRWLEVLDLRSNSLSGVVPKHLQNLTRLQQVDLSDNQLVGVDAHAFTSSSNDCLLSVKLNSNRLSSIPTQMIHLSRLQSLDLSHNSIQCKLPDFSLAAALRYLSIRANYAYGSLPPLPTQSLISADLSGNHLNGSIPQEWTLLETPQFLDVSHNEISGTIPQNLALLRTALRITFRASDNRITGTLPQLPFKDVDITNNYFHCPLPLTPDWTTKVGIVGLTQMSCDNSQEQVKTRQKEGAVERES